MVVTVKSPNAKQAVKAKAQPKAPKDSRASRFTWNSGDVQEA